MTDYYKRTRILGGVCEEMEETQKELKEIVKFPTFQTKLIKKEVEELMPLIDLMLNFRAVFAKFMSLSEKNLKSYEKQREEIDKKIIRLVEHLEACAKKGSKQIKKVGGFFAKIRSQKSYE